MADVPSLPKFGRLPVPVQRDLEGDPSVPPEAPAGPGASPGDAAHGGASQVSPEVADALAKGDGEALLRALAGSVAPEPDNFNVLAAALRDVAVDVQGVAPEVARAATELAADLTGVQSFADLPERFAMDVSLLKGQLVNVPGAGPAQDGRAQRLFEFFVPYAARFVQLAQEANGSTPTSEPAPPRADAPASAPIQVERDVPLHEAPPAPVQEAQRDFREPRPQVTQGKLVTAEVADPGLDASAAAKDAPAPAPAAPASGGDSGHGQEGQQQGRHSGQGPPGGLRLPKPVLPGLDDGPAAAPGRGDAPTEGGRLGGSAEADGLGIATTASVAEEAPPAQPQGPPAGSASTRAAPAEASLKVPFDGARLQPGPEVAGASKGTRVPFNFSEGPPQEMPRDPKAAAVEHFSDALRNVGLDKSRDLSSGRDGVAVSRDLLQSRSVPEVHEKASAVALRPAPEDPRVRTQEPTRGPADAQGPLRAAQAPRPEAPGFLQPLGNERVPFQQSAQNPAQVVLPQLNQPMQRVQDTGRMDHRDPWASQRKGVLGKSSLWNVLHTLRGKGADSVEDRDNWNRTVVIALLLLAATTVMIIILVNL